MSDEAPRTGMGPGSDGTSVDATAAPVRRRRRRRRRWDAWKGRLFWLWWLLSLPFHLLISGWNFRSRRTRDLLYAIPALAVAIGVLTVTVAAKLNRGDPLVNQYRRAAALAFRSADYLTAETCYERLLIIDGNRPELQYRLALTAEKLKQPERAEALMRALASVDSQGHAPAHYWLACRLLGEPRPTPAAIGLAESHLKWTLRAQPDALESHAMLAQIYIATGRPNRAMPHLERAAERSADYRLLLAAAYRAQGNETKARAEAERVLQAFRDQVEARPQDHRARWYRAQAALFLGDFVSATATLKEGWKMRPGREPYGAALARAYCEWANATKNKQPADLGQVFGLVQEALRYDAACAPALSLLVEIGRDSAARREQVRQTLHDLLGRGESLALVHLSLAQLAWPNEAAAARHHLEQAYRQGKEMGVVVNNLAWVLAHADPPDLSRALAMIESNVARWPNEKRYRGTRGHILAKLGRWADALADLETMLTLTPDDRQLHATLAEVYTKLGMSAEAAEHRRRAQ